MELILALASLKCFELEPRTKRFEQNMLARMERQTAIDLAELSPEQGQQSARTNGEAGDEPGYNNATEWTP